MGGSHNRSRVRRIITRVLVFLLLGALVNVAVAWVLYLWRPFEGRPFGYSHVTAGEAERVWDRCWPRGTQFADNPRARKYTVHSTSTRTPGYRIIIVWHSLTRQRPNNPEGWAWEMQAGWPASSLVGHKWGFDQSNHGLLVIKDSWIPARRTGTPIIDDYLPLNPLCLGFMINTLFYAAILWLLFATPHAFRLMKRGWRSERGLCPKCGYPIGTSAVCTECGTLLPHHRGLDSR